MPFLLTLNKADTFYECFTTDFEQVYFSLHKINCFPRIQTMIKANFYS